MIKNLNHANIIKIYYSNAYDNFSAFELELLDITLDGVIQDNKEANVAMSSDKVRVIVRQLLEALRYLHSQNVVHRDLKPQNIGFRERDNMQSLKIFDFGLSAKTVKENSNLLASKVGTILYMAPEIFSKKEYSSVS